MHDKSVIEIKNLTKYYHTYADILCAVKNLNLKVHHKQIVSIMGPSGCGKTTILKMLGGMLKPSSGEIVYFNQTFTEGIPEEFLKKIGYVFQIDNLLPWRTVQKNLELPLEVLGFKGKEWIRRIDDLLEMVGLSDYKYAYPHELSGGMKQRIGVIRALVHNPEIILMDQPFGSLDAITRKLLNYEFLSLWKKTKKTIMLITNDIEEALLLSSKIYLLSNPPGEIVNEIDFNVSAEERNRALVKSKKFNQMSLKLRRLIKEEKLQVS